MWRKFAGPLFHSSMFKLSADQRLEIQKQIEFIAADPHNPSLNPIMLDDDTREVEVAGVWLRYRVDDKEKRVIFLQASSL
jgi:hypothetical protein